MREYVAPTAAAPASATRLGFTVARRLGFAVAAAKSSGMPKRHCGAVLRLALVVVVVMGFIPRVDAALGVGAKARSEGQSSNMSCADAVAV